MLHTKEEIKQWLDTHKVENYTINDDLTVDVKGSVDLMGYNITLFPFQWGIIEENFTCIGVDLISLQGAPRKVMYSFDCSHNLLTSLEGGPEYVGRDYDADGNQLTSIKGIAKHVGEFLFLKDNPLKVIDDYPEYIGENMQLSDGQYKIPLFESFYKKLKNGYTSGYLTVENIKAVLRHEKLNQNLPENDSTIKNKFKI